MTSDIPGDGIPWVVGFGDALAADEKFGIELVGGKGHNLARLTRAGLPVPGGFFISTRAYACFVEANRLGERISAALAESQDQGLERLEQASADIRAAFNAGGMPGEVKEALLAAYREMGEPPAAVRSSATAEDLPDLSFAGQQDTFLNVSGEEALIKAVVECWSSLWTARAIGYRLRNGIDQAGVALAVAVQHMVESQVSGVLFTANPLNGLRSETVIDATFGLGEALVSGKVEPDHYLVDAARGMIKSKTLGAKKLSIRGKAGGGVAEMAEDAGAVQALPDEAILDLSRLGQQVAGLYGAPQDIEWAWVEGKIHLLQSRAITSLFPTPDGMPPEPLMVMISFAAVQGMLDPITPLGGDALKLIFATGAGLLHIRVTAETQTALFSAGERLWVNVTGLVRNSIGRKIVPAALGYVEPSTQQAILSILDDPRLQPGGPGIRLGRLRQLAGFMLPLAGNVIANLRSPRARREMILEGGEKVLETMRERAAAIQGDRRARLVQLGELLPGVARDTLPKTLLRFVSGVVAGMASFAQLNLLASHLPENADLGPCQSGHDLVLEITRGLAHNPTTEMDLALWRTAQALRASPEAWAEFSGYPASELSGRFTSGEMPAAARKVVAGFLEQYGGRGLGEIDLGRSRWMEDPTHVFEALGGFLQIENGPQAPDAVFARSAVKAQAAIDCLCAALRKTRGGWFKARLARFFAGRVRELMGMRESPKFFAVRMMAILREELLRIGQEFAAAGELRRADDLFYLTLGELKAFGAGAERDWAGLIERRRERYRRELLRRQVPRLLLSDGRAFYEGMAAPEDAGNGLHGSPVSPGSAEGRVRVVFDPRQAHLLPGEILVCPGTDPSWTPLFLTAAGLLMEVGGMMTHGAVVAREYGIPAIVGVDRVTERLVTGQRIRMDGSSGLITLLDDYATIG